jgi:hypothetical protein
MQRIADIGAIIDETELAPAKLKKTIDQYKELAARQTTHPARREKRQKLLVECIEAIK